MDSCFPPNHLLTKQERALWRSLGRTLYISPFMRSVLVGAHSHSECLLVKKQIRLIARRNKALGELGISVPYDLMDLMAEKNLERFGWWQSEGTWRHAFWPRGFSFSNSLDESMWRKMAHALRESYRKDNYEKLQCSGQHDANEMATIPYDPLRRKLALQWARKHDDFDAGFWSDFFSPPEVLFGIPSRLPVVSCP